jgi:hypothetical protein
VLQIAFESFERIGDTKFSAYRNVAGIEIDLAWRFHAPATRVSN